MIDQPTGKADRLLDSIPCSMKKSRFVLRFLSGFGGEWRLYDGARGAGWKSVERLWSCRVRMIRRTAKNITHGGHRSGNVDEEYQQRVGVLVDEKNYRWGTQMVGVVLVGIERDLREVTEPKAVARAVQA